MHCRYYNKKFDTNRVDIKKSIFGVFIYLFIFFTCNFNSFLNSQPIFF